MPCAVLPTPRWPLAVALVAVASIAGVPPGPAAAQGLKLHESLEQLQLDARRDSNDAAAQYALALGYWSKHRWDDAERALRLAISIEPRFAPGYLALSVLPFARRPKLREDEAKGKVSDEWKPALEESDRFMRRAFLIDPLVDLRILGAVDPPRRMVMSLGAGRFMVLTSPLSALEEGQYAAAYSFFNLALESRENTAPHDSIPSFLLWYHGLCAAHLDLDSIAIADFDTLLGRALTREQGDSILKMPLHTNDYRYLLALMYQREHRWQDAVRMYHDALANDLGLYMAHVQLYRIFEQRGFLDSAAAESRAAVLSNPDDPTLFMEHGMVLIENGQFAAAEDTLRHATEADPRDSRGYYFLAIAEQQLGKRADARATFERFLALAPSRLTDKIADARRQLAMLQ